MFAALLNLPFSVLIGQLLLGLINGSFYALLSLGLSIIFGLLNIINFVQGAYFMVGAFVAYFLMQSFGVSYWGALLLAPLAVGLLAVVVEQTMLRRLYKLDHVYGWLLTFGLSLMLESVFRQIYGASGKQYGSPPLLSGGVDLDVMFLPTYRVWVVLVSAVVCFGVWFAIERTRLGSYLRASTENAELVRAFGINVPRLLTLTYGCAAALAGFAGVLAAPIFQVSPGMGSNIIVILFATVVIGGLGSIAGTVLTGITLGVIEAFTKVIYPEGSQVAIFVLMAAVLVIKPAGLFSDGKARTF
jgi:branched-chain amino acid transport system permease protein